MKTGFKGNNFVIFILASFSNEVKCLMEKFAPLRACFSVKSI